MAYQRFQKTSDASPTLDHIVYIVGKGMEEPFSLTTLVEKIIKEGYIAPRASSVAKSLRDMDCFHLAEGDNPLWVYKPNPRSWKGWRS